MAMCSALVLLPLLRAARGDGSLAAAAAPVSEAQAPLRRLGSAGGDDASRGSCAYYGCSDAFRVMWACQCNPGCELQNNCCHDHASTCRAPARSLVDGGVAMALRMDDNAPWAQDGAQVAAQPVDAGVRVAPNAGTMDNLQDEMQQKPPQRKTVELPSQPLTPTRPSQPLTPTRPSQPPSQPPASSQMQPPQVPQDPQLVERRTADGFRPRPRSDYAQQHKKPARWILPLAAVFAVVGTVLLAIAGARKWKLCSGTAAPKVRTSAVMPLTVSVDRQDAPANDDIVSTFESQVKEAKQRAKSLTRKSYASQARPANR